MEDFPQERPRFWIAFSILCIAVAVAIFMVVFTSTRVEAQEQPPACFHVDGMVANMEEYFHARLIWQGVKSTPHGQIETFLFQAQDGTWAQVDVLGKDPTGKPVGCFVANGTNGVPNELGKGV